MLLNILVTQAPLPTSEVSQAPGTRQTPHSLLAGLRMDHQEEASAPVSEPVTRAARSTA